MKRKLWAVFRLLPMLAAGLGCGCASTIHRGAELDLTRQQLNAQAVHSLRQPLARQAARGESLDATVWTHHFDSADPGQLHPGGRAHLDRLARDRLNDPRSEPLCVSVQRSRGAASTPGTAPDAPAAFALDSVRGRAVYDYLRGRWPDVPVQVALGDPQPVGMSAVEAGTVLGRSRDPDRGLKKTEEFFPSTYSGSPLVQQTTFRGEGFNNGEPSSPQPTTGSGDAEAGTVPPPPSSPPASNLPPSDLRP